MSATREATPTTRERKGRIENAGVYATGLVKTFGDDIRAVDGIDLHIEAGEIYSLLGRNGSGKTTTVEMLTTLLPPTQGTATVGGFDVVREAGAVRLRIGVALQEVALDPLMTAWDHMRLQAALHGMGRREARVRTRELLASVDLLDVADRRTRTYSGGMKRRLDLALALVHRPKVLFLDEPTTGLDPHSRSAIWREVQHLAGQGVAIFLTTQYLDEAEQLATWVAIIEKGTIVKEGSPRQLIEEVGPRSIAVTTSPDQSATAEMTLQRFGGVQNRGDEVICHSNDDISDVVRALDAAGVTIINMQVKAPTLEDVFFAETGRGIEPEHGGG